VVEEVGERFGRFQDAECRALKSDLTGMEEAPGNGRVRLGDFYRSALEEGKWQFAETADYLRVLGALDESDPSTPRVIIPNYLNSPSNCIASSAYYGVCCIDECEALLGNLERHIGAPTARPEEIWAIVSNSRPANESLPYMLAGRLQEVATHHGGRVPLHGRLFAQWLHYAHPRECAFPHVAGEKRPRTAEDWKNAGQEATATVEEMVSYVEAARRGGPNTAAKNDGLCSSMWHSEEQLVDERAHQAEASRERWAKTVAKTLATVRAALGGVALLAAVASAAVALARTLLPALGQGTGKVSVLKAHCL